VFTRAGVQFSLPTTQYCGQSIGQVKGHLAADAVQSSARSTNSWADNHWLRPTQTRRRRRCRSPVRPSVRRRSTMIAISMRRCVAARPPACRWSTAVAARMVTAITAAGRPATSRLQPVHCARCGSHRGQGRAGSARPGSGREQHCHIISASRRRLPACSRMKCLSLYFAPPPPQQQQQQLRHHAAFGIVAGHHMPKP